METILLRAGQREQTIESNFKLCLSCIWEEEKPQRFPNKRIRKFDGKQHKRQEEAAEAKTNEIRLVLNDKQLWLAS